MNEQDHQALLKAKYCPRAMPAQHFANAGQLVQAASCTQKHTKNHVTLTLIFNRLLQVVKVHVRAKLHHTKRSGL